MTKEEVIERIEGLYGIAKHESLDDEEDKEAVDIAIKLLEQEPILDKIETEIRELFKGPAYYIPNYEAYKQILGIINKYKVESEDKE